MSMDSGPFNVLIAEDEDLNFLFLDLLLRKVGNGMYAIYRAINGQEAVDYCNSHEVDIVLMDLKMPVMDGFEATSIIKKAYPKLPIIVQTAYTGELDRQKAFECGCDEYMTKPIQKEDLVAVMKQFLPI